MSYLLDKKAKKSKYIKYAIVVFALLLVLYLGVLGGFSFVAHFIFRPVFNLGNSIGGKFSNMGDYFYSKRLLSSENEDLKLKILEQESRMANYDSILEENFRIKEILGRANPAKEMLLAGILSKSNRSPYDTIIIDAGESEGVLKDQRAFAVGNIPIGRVSEVYAHSSVVILYSTPGEKTSVFVPLFLPKDESITEATENITHDTFMEAIGRGGGNFEMILLRDFVIKEGAEVTLPGTVPFVLGIVETIISDPRDSFQKALLVSPVNIQEIKFVQVEM